MYFDCARKNLPVVFVNFTVPSRTPNHPGGWEGLCLQTNSKWYGSLGTTIMCIIEVMYLDWTVVDSLVWPSLSSNLVKDSENNQHSIYAFHLNITLFTTTSFPLLWKFKENFDLFSVVLQRQLQCERNWKKKWHKKSYKKSLTHW